MRRCILLGNLYGHSPVLLGTVQSAAVDGSEQVRKEVRMKSPICCISRMSLRYEYSCIRVQSVALLRQRSRPKSALGLVGMMRSESGAKAVSLFR